MVEDAFLAHIEIEERAFNKVLEEIRSYFGIVNELYETLKKDAKERIGLMKHIMKAAKESDAKELSRTLSEFSRLVQQQTEKWRKLEGELLSCRMQLTWYLGSSPLKIVLFNFLPQNIGFFY
jgi:flagellin-specific chaperone FliS